MGAIVSKRRNVQTTSPEETTETSASAVPPPESRARSSAGTASASLVGIPLPSRPLPLPRRSLEESLESSPAADSPLTPPATSPPATTPPPATTTPPATTPPVTSQPVTSPRSRAETESSGSSATLLSSATADTRTSETSERRRKLVERCLRSLEAAFEIAFEREQLLSCVREIRHDPGETLMAARQPAVGVYIVSEGGLEVFSLEEDAAALCSLVEGDFCGELSSFFRIPCTATVRTRRGISTTAVLLLPVLALSESSHIQQVPMHRMLTWCTKRSYINTGIMFDKSKSAHLVNAQIANCLKAPKSLFSNWSSEAINFMATKSNPLLFDSGDVLYEVGEEAPFYFLLLRGSVEMISDTDGSGRPYCLTVRSSSEGTSIGRELFAGSRMAHTATALSPLLTVPISLDLLKDTVNQFPNDAGKLKDIQDGNFIQS